MLAKINVNVTKSRQQIKQALGKAQPAEDPPEVINHLEELKFTTESFNNLFKVARTLAGDRETTMFPVAEDALRRCTATIDLKGASYVDKVYHAAKLDVEAAREARVEAERLKEADSKAHNLPSLLELEETGARRYREATDSLIGACVKLENKRDAEYNALVDGLCGALRGLTPHWRRPHHSPTVPSESVPGAMAALAMLPVAVPILSLPVARPVDVPVAEGTERFIDGAAESSPGPLRSTNHTIPASSTGWLRILKEPSKEENKNYAKEHKDHSKEHKEHSKEHKEHSKEHKGHSKEHKEYSKDKDYSKEKQDRRSAELQMQAQLQDDVMEVLVLPEDEEESSI